MEGTATVQFVKTAGHNRIGTYYKARDGYTAQEVLDHLRGCRISGFFTKSASIGGSTEEGFEQAFSSLAYAYMKDKAPRLLDFMVGFQLVDRNEDNTKAMGIFGFQVGDQWLYAPVFFLNGDLKGHELLYIKKQDSFVPMKENWVNYLMSRKPHVLGEGSKQDTYELGGAQPDIRGMSISPNMGIGKRGCDEWARPFMPFIGAGAAKSARFLFSSAKPGTKLAMDQVISAPLQAACAEVSEKFAMDKVLTSNFGLLKTAFELSQRFPGIKKAFDQFYGKDCFSRWAREAKGQAIRESSSLIKERPKTAGDVKVPPTFTGNSLIPDTPLPEGPIKSGALRVYVREQFSISTIGADDELDETGEEQLTADDKSEILHNGYLVKDERSGEQITKAYNTQLTQRLSNPHESGIYDVLEKPGKFSRMVVISHPYTNRGQENFCTVIRLSDSSNKSWLNSHRNTIWADKVEERKDYEEWFDKQGGRDSLQKDGVYMAVDANGSGTTPFRVREVYGDGSYKVDFKDSCYGDDGRPGFMPTVARDSNDGPYISTWDAMMFVDAEGKRGTKLRNVSGELRVPGTFKFVKLKSPPKPKKEVGSCCLMPEPMDSSERSDEDEPILPGRIEDIQMMFHEKTARMKLYDDHNELDITSPLGRKRLTKKAALLHLISTHGLTEKTACDMIKQAEAKRAAVFRLDYAPGFGTKRGMVKEAFGGMLAGGPSAPAMPPPEMGIEMLGGRNAVRAQYPDEQHMMVDQMDSSMLDPSVHDLWQNYTAEDFQSSMGVAQQAAQSGQKEVFDTAMISGLLKTVRQDSLVDRYLGDLMKALDKLGRILFLFYWHQEEFEDRYGKADLPELEDSLRNSFEALGDVALFLKEKTIEPAFGEMGEPNLEETARN